MSKFKSGTFEKHSSSIIGPAARIEPASFAREHRLDSCGRSVVDDDLFSA